MAGDHRGPRAFVPSRQPPPAAGKVFISIFSLETLHFESPGWKWSVAGRATPHVGAPLRCTNRKYMIKDHTRRLAWISLE